MKPWFIVIIVVLCILTFLLLWELSFDIARHRDRKIKWKCALADAQSRNRKIVVIGDPYGSNGTKVLGRGTGYGCGDVCVDLHGCPTCPTSVTSDAEAFLKTQEANSATVFISNVLEYVDDAASTYAEAKRVHGGPPIVVRMHPLCLSSIFYKGSRWVIHSLEPFKVKRVRLSV